MDGAYGTYSVPTLTSLSLPSGLAAIDESVLNFELLQSADVGVWKFADNLLTILRWKHADLPHSFLSRSTTISISSLIYECVFGEAFLKLLLSRAALRDVDLAFPMACARDTANALVSILKRVAAHCELHSITLHLVSSHFNFMEFWTYLANSSTPTLKTLKSFKALYPRSGRPSIQPVGPAGAGADARARAGCRAPSAVHHTVQADAHGRRCGPAATSGNTTFEVVEGGAGA